MLGEALILLKLVLFFFFFVSVVIPLPMLSDSQQGVAAFGVEWSFLHVNSLHSTQPNTVICACSASGQSDHPNPS